MRTTNRLLTLFLSLLVCLGIKANEETLYDLTVDDFYSWSSAGADASKNGNTGCAYDLNVSTGMPYGDSNVFYLNYADLSNADKLYIVATEGAPRALFNRIVNNGTVNVETPSNGKYQTIVDNADGSKTYVIDISMIYKEYGFAHLHAIKGANWQNTTVTSIKYSLREEEIEFVETVIPEGFTKLERSDFYSWSAAGANGIKGNPAYCAYDLNISTGMPYGDGNVYYLNYANLSNVNTIQVTVTEGVPRLLFNRTVDNGPVGVETPRDGDYQQIVNNADGSSTYIINVLKIIEKDGFAHLHAIKGSNGNVYVTSIIYDTLETAPVLPEEPDVDEPIVDNEKLINLTADDFHEWSAGDKSGVMVNENAYGAYVLGESTGLPYGNGSVLCTLYADLSNADKLYITVTEGTPRCLFNRIVNEGDVPVETPRDGIYQSAISNADGSTTYVIDVAQIVKDNGYAHLNAIKGANWADVTVKSITYTLASETPDTPQEPTTEDYSEGDVNGDGNVTISDLKMLLDILNGSVEDNGNADVNLDGKVSKEDADALNAILLGTYTPEYNWVGTWTSAQYLIAQADQMPPAMGLSNNSFRQIVQVSVGGKKLRFKFSNEFSKEATEIKSVDIALARTSGYNSNIYENTVKTLTFDGNESVTMKAGEMVVSDPVSFNLSPRDNVAITIHYGKCSETITGHPGSRTMSYLVAGNTNNFSGATSTDHWYNICGIDVVGNKKTRAVAVLGNSITDGRGTTTNKQDRWTDEFSRSLLENDATKDVAVLNLGIGGNAIVGGGLGPRGVDRFDRDILQQAGVKYVIIFIGVNDIGGGVPASQIIPAYTSLAEKAHAQGLKVYGATITPFKNSGYYQADPVNREATRKAVNEWIRTNTVYDGYIDFDAAVKDPNDPEALPTKYLFQNDWLHLNGDGYTVMGRSIDLKLFEE